jgi:nickel/cobalt exporter
MLFSELVGQSAHAAWLFIPSAILLGALHGLEPGHSKTMMAAFIVAIRGTVAQAVLLAVTATISHTAIVWLVAILALTYGSQWSAETTEPYFQLASAAIIIGVALWIAARTWRDQQAAKAAAAHSHGHGELAHDETKVINTGHGLLQLSVFEDGVPPRFRVHFLDRSARPLLPPEDETVTVEIVRPDGSRAVFEFERQGEYLEATRTLPEPHEFAATVAVAHGGHAHQYAVEFREAGHGHHESHSHSHGHSHGGGHGHGHGGHSHGGHGHGGHGHGGLNPDDAGFQDAHERAHALDIQRRFTGRKVTTGQIALFGLTGGLLPCPAAVTVLLLCLQLQRFWLGMVLVLCFSIGLALTLVASGTVAALGMHHASRRWPGFDAFARRLPYASSAIVIAMGLYVGVEGWKHLS